MDGLDSLVIASGVVIGIEFLLGFQQFLSFDVIPGAAVENIGNFQLAQIIIYRFVIQCPVLAFQIIGNRVCRKIIARIVKNIANDPFWLIDLPYPVALSNVRETV